MGISVEGQQCPICHAYFIEGDDVVFCPECGAPHHRDCYHSVGECAFKEKHNTPEQYTRPKPTSNMQPHQSEPKEDVETEKTCPHCGQHFVAKGNVCPFCGKPLSMGQTPFGTPIVFFDAMGGVGKDETIEGIPATEVRDYVVVNTPRYLPRFKQLHHRRKCSWNWAAFFVPNAWYFYRKMYFPGILFFLFSVVANVMISALSLALVNVPEEALVNTAAMAKYLAEHLHTIPPVFIGISIAGIGFGLILRVVSALFGDWIYRTNALSRIHTLHEKSEENSNTPFAAKLRRAGGVNPTLGLLGLFGLQWVVQILFLFI